MEREQERSDDSSRSVSSLEEEIKVLRNALREKECLIDQLLAGKRSSPVKPVNDSPFRFLDLPPELRNTIYEMCTVSGKLFLRPRPKYDSRYDDYENYAKPTWQLLRVNRQVRQEASEVLFSKNLCIFSYRGTEWRRFGRENNYDYKDLLLPKIMHDNISSASITMDLRGLEEDPLRLAFYCRFGATADGDWTSKTVNERVLASHSNVTFDPYAWEVMFSELSPRKLLEIHLDHCYCPLGCHRFIDRVKFAMDDYVSFGPEAKIVFFGVKTSAERKKLLDALREKTYYKNAESVVVRFEVIKRLKFFGSLDYEEGLQDAEFALDENLDGQAESSDVESEEDI